VRKVEGKKIKKGVVFINETVPFKIVALLANKLYKEDYISIPTKNTIDIGEHKHINYEWKMKNKRTTYYYYMEISLVKRKETKLDSPTLY
jgi:hypothetical protein